MIILNFFTLYELFFLYFDEKNYYIKTSFYYNLSIANYALEKYDEGIYHLEKIYRVYQMNFIEIAALLNIL